MVWLGGAEMTPPINETFVRELTLLYAQALSAIKKAVRDPGMIHTTVLDVGPVDEVEVQVIATYRKKLILPVDNVNEV